MSLVLNELFIQYQETGNVLIYNKLILKLHKYYIKKIKRICIRHHFRDYEEIESLLNLLIPQEIDKALTRLIDDDFEAYICYRIPRRIADYIRHYNHFKPVLNYEELYYEKLYYEDKPNDIEYNIYYNDLTYSEVQYIESNLLGFKDIEIATALGYSKSHLCAIKNCLFNKLRKVLEC